MPEHLETYRWLHRTVHRPRACVGRGDRAREMPSGAPLRQSPQVRSGWAWKRVSVGTASFPNRHVLDRAGRRSAVMLPILYHSWIYRCSREREESIIPRRIYTQTRPVVNSNNLCFRRRNPRGLAMASDTGRAATVGATNPIAIAARRGSYLSPICPVPIRLGRSAAPARSSLLREAVPTPLPCAASS